MMKAQRALLSVSNKTGLTDFARGLVDLGIQAISTGGTYAALEDAGIPATRVSEVTGFPEILDGRVKTLHPAIYGGILADRGNADHLTQLTEHGFQPIDLVVVNLYPFRQTAERSGATPEEIIEMIDIGGPTMVRAAAKNHAAVGVVVDPADYDQILAALEEHDRVLPDSLRRRLALKAFRHTQRYDAAIATWLEGELENDANGDFPRHYVLDLERALEPRYGENPHQPAAVYRTTGGDGLFGGFEQLHGKKLSYNNLLDTDAARRLVAHFEAPTVVIVKHNNPCGVGSGENLTEAYERALACDPISAYGSIVATNRAVSEALAEPLSELFVEVVVAPDFDAGALERLTAKKNVRLLRAPLPIMDPSPVELRAVDGGYLAQVCDLERDDRNEFSAPSKRQPNESEHRALEFAWTVARFVKSNAIVITNEHQSVGIGAGQMSRVDSCRIAIQKAQLPLSDTVAASDAFFPFRDGLDVLAEAGVTAVIQPGGSKRDGEVIAAADEQDIAMIMTGRRHFRH